MIRFNKDIKYIIYSGTPLNKTQGYKVQSLVIDY